MAPEHSELSVTVVDSAWVHFSKELTSGNLKTAETDLTPADVSKSEKDRWHA